MSEQNLLDVMIARTKLSKKQTDKQQKIVEAAIRIFAEKGYSNTSTSEIAQAAGVAEGTIFRHFGTKDNLLLSVILPFLKEWVPVMAEDVFQEIMSEEASFEDFVRALIKNRIAFIKENKEVFQVVVKEFLYNEELRKELFPHLSESIGSRLTNVLQRFQARGELADIPIDRLKRMLISFVGAQFVSRFVLLPEIQDLDEDAEVEAIVKFIMNGIGK
ncbi:TetR/AcrR family transcriptional regulator [Sediminibacillus massiliensis]|uniref:TetR/AcrR family transcriptional regulator n=1 Tax=Sediminibacillus massiliensis TaxID=1926277 RepID=UPI000988875A|nr:TetR/AcrR family transcriptional regulator [Sediminibacillus massiliensis]